MQAELLVLGGAEEIGANCAYLRIGGTGMFIDAGLHPRLRNQMAFPDVNAMASRDADAVFVTHAHADHIGALPFLLRAYPHLRTIMTPATRDIARLTLANGSKLIRKDLAPWYTPEQLEFYNRDTLALLQQSFETLEYNKPVSMQSHHGSEEVTVTAHWAGHILGSCSYEIVCQGYRIIHTGDIQFSRQFFLKGASPPRGHADVLITECTNVQGDLPNDYQGELQRLAASINKISGSGGSVLIPCFSLGKTQELLCALYRLMQRGTIPTLPLYTAGLGRKLNKVYDTYCYKEPTIRPGFEISDIPQLMINQRDVGSGDYLKEPSIVLASSGMLHKDTTSFQLAKIWFSKPNFGICFVGYQDPDAPGTSILHSKKNEPFSFAGATVKRSCSVERFRFSAHATGDDLVSYILDIRPKLLVITHGSIESCEKLALIVREALPRTRILIPRAGVPYLLTATSS
jgi:Cft2 family RNA processing exonuclease